MLFGRGRAIGMLALVVAGLALSSSAPAAQIVESDLCVYGGTSGGIIAAVQAARMGKTAVVVEPGRHVGGMTSGGLGNTDTSNYKASIGGLAREFYRRVGQHYGLSETFTFEPHVAEQVYLAMLQEVSVPVYYQQTLASVAKSGQRITSLTTVGGDEFRAKMFIDATYEGDLLAMAGVSFTVGRESSADHGESLNGIRANTPAHQFAVPVDPYVTPGDPLSGLLPFIQDGDGGTPGDGDHRVQAYNFRLCLTQVETNKLPIAPPAGYDASRYELLGRYIEARVNAGHALTLGSFLNIATMPNGKTDMNNNGAFSTDYIGMNYTYPTNTPAGRAAIWQEHEDYTRGFLTFLATDSRVPANVQSQMLSWGLCADEFQDTGGWPHQLYVREARRMVSDYMMTQSNCMGLVVAPDSVGLASYNMDSHNCQRVVQWGAVANEGDVQQAPGGPFPISYRSLIPRVGECENLLATFCLSGTHIAFSSCRMEPVFMMTSQSAAAAAVFAIDDNVSVQNVPYGKLRLQLIADRQILQWGGSAASTNSIILDSEQIDGVTIAGTWTASKSQTGYLGANYLHDGDVDKGFKSVLFTPDLPTAGVYTVSLRWTTNANRATNVPLTLAYDGGVTNMTVNQRNNNGVWVALATLPFAAGTGGSLLIETTGTDGYVIADAVQWQPATAPPPTTVEIVASDSVAAEGGANPATFSVVRSGDTANALSVTYAVSGTATAGDDYPAVSGSVVIPPGHASVALTLRPLDDALTEGDESIALTLTPGAEYQLGAYSNASAVLRDGGFGLWRADRFTPAELADPGISGALADPDVDRTPNLLEYFLGCEPKTSNVPPGVWLDSKPGDWQLAWRRAAEAASLHLRVETSPDLAQWFLAPFSAQTPEVSDASPLQELRFPLGDPTLNAGRAFYRVVVSEKPLALTTNDAHFFFSFDTALEGTGTFAAAVSAADGFVGAPVAGREGTVFTETGGAASFTDFNGVTWLGSGSSTAPGHCLAFNPGSTGNRCLLTFSTLGLRQVRLRMDVRSAAQAGGVAPDAFTSFSYDVGGGPQPAPGVDLSLAPDNQFHEWAVDLSTLTAIDNQHTVTLSWTLKNLSASPMESLRIDNIQVTASPVED